jgi:hypothetical protein
LLITIESWIIATTNWIVVRVFKIFTETKAINSTFIELAVKKMLKILKGATINWLELMK